MFNIINNFTGKEQLPTISSFIKTNPKGGIALIQGVPHLITIDWIYKDTWNQDKGKNYRCVNLDTMKTGIRSDTTLIEPLNAEIIINK